MGYLVWEIGSTQFCLILSALVLLLAECDAVFLKCFRCGTQIAADMVPIAGRLRLVCRTQQIGRREPYETTPNRRSSGLRASLLCSA